MTRSRSLRASRTGVFSARTASGLSPDLRAQGRLKAVAGERYLIVGGGLAADGACRSIREHDRRSPITLVGEERYSPYNRPLLTKGLWHGEPEDALWRRTEELGVELVLGRRI